MEMLSLVSFWIKVVRDIAVKIFVGAASDEGSLKPRTFNEYEKFGEIWNRIVGDVELLAFHGN